jgi:hypothetical protein
MPRRGFLNAPDRGRWASAGQSGPSAMRLLACAVSLAVTLHPAGAILRAAPPPEAGVSAPVESSSVDEAYEARLRELEEKVVNLKEKVFRSKTRLMLLKERLLNDVIAEARVVIRHKNDMGSAFKPLAAIYYLDGERIWFADPSSRVLETASELEVFNQNLAPGNHVLSVEMVYRGDSPLFAYLKDYEFKLRASYTFFAAKGKITAVRAMGYQKGDFTWDLRERPSISFDTSQTSYTASEAEKALESQGVPAGGGPAGTGPGRPDDATPANPPAPAGPSSGSAPGSSGAQP